MFVLCFDSCLVYVKLTVWFSLYTPSASLVTIFLKRIFSFISCVYGFFVKQQKVKLVARNVKVPFKLSVC